MTPSATAQVSDLIFKIRVLKMMVTASYEEWRDHVWSRDLDEPFCCDGRECGCGGDTVREMWGWHINREPQP